MPRKRKTVEPETKLPRLPFSLGNRASFVNKGVVVVEKMGDTFVGLQYSVAYGVVEDVWIDKCDMAYNAKEHKKYWIDGYHVLGGPEQIVKTHLQWLKAQAIEGGATPEAIRLLGKVTHLTRKEEAEMAAKEKLRKKAEKPVGGGGKVAKEKGVRKGNPEALKKARETRAANVGAPDVRKIKLINKENPYREGSGRAASFDALKGAKTVEEYKAAGGKAKYLSRWESEGRIALS